MSIYTKMFAVLFFSLVTSFAQAGFHLEPYLGFSVDGEWDAGTKDDATMTEFGVKLGYQAPNGLQVGGDIQLGTGEYDNLLGAGVSGKAANAATGVYLGYQSDFGLRGYAVYLLASALNFNDVLDTTISGKGFKLGVGYSIIPWVAVNLEYHMMTYDEAETALGGSADLDPKVKNNFIFATVSFPFDFGGRR